MKKLAIMSALLFGAVSLVLSTSVFAVVDGPGPTQDMRSNAKTPNGKTQADKHTNKTIRVMPKAAAVAR